MRRTLLFRTLTGLSGACLLVSAGLAQDVRTSNQPGTEHLLPRVTVPAGEGGVAGIVQGLYGLSSTSPGVLYTINSANGLATIDTALNGDASFTGISFRFGTELYGTDLINYPGGTGTWEMGRIDPVSGVITFENNQAGSADWHGLATNETTGELYSMDPFATVLQVYDPGTGVITPVGAGTGIDARGMAYDDANGILYAADSNTNSLYTINTATGTSAVVGALGVATNFRVGLAYDELTGTLYMNIGEVTATLYTVNTATGAATAVGGNGVTDIDGLAWVGPPPGCGSSAAGNCCIANGSPFCDDAGCCQAICAVDPFCCNNTWDSICANAARVHPQCCNLWGLSSGSPGNLYVIDESSGAATLVTVLNGDPSLTGLSWAQGALYGSDLNNYPGGSGGWDLGGIDPLSGVITFINDRGGDENWQGLASNETTGDLYSIDSASGTTDLKVTDPITGVITIVGPTGIDGRGMAYDDFNGILYSTDDISQSLYSVNTATGASALIGPLGIVLEFTNGLAYDEQSQTLYLNNGGTAATLYTVNTATGAATAVGPNGVTNIDGLAWKGKPAIPPLEACCLPNGSCQDLNAADCTAAGGIPQGVGSDCSTTTCPIPSLISADGLWTADLDAAGQLFNVVHPLNGDFVFETLVYAAHPFSSQLSERIETTWAVTEGPTVSPDQTQAHTRLVHPTGQLSIEIDIAMISGPNGGALVRITCENKDPAGAIGCKVFVYADYDVTGAGNDEVTLITNPNGAIRALEQIDVADPNRAVWFGGCKPYKSYSIQTFAGLRALLDAGLPQLDGIDSTAPGPADHTFALSTEKAVLPPGGVSVSYFGLGAPNFAGCPGVPCPADFDGNGVIDAADLAVLLGAWGPVPGCPPFIPPDLVPDCIINAADLAQLLGAWGPCP